MGKKTRDRITEDPHRCPKIGPKTKPPALLVNVFGPVPGEGLARTCAAIAVAPAPWGMVRIRANTGQ